MKSNEEIERQTEAALNSLNGLVQLEASYFTHSKVMNRLQQHENAERLFNRSLLRAAFVLLLLVAVNVAAFTLVSKSSDKKQTDISQFAGAYGLQLDSYNY